MRRHIVAVSVLLALAGCGSELQGPSSDPPAGGAAFARDSLEMMCQLGCIPGEPPGDDPGEYVTAITRSFCLDTSGATDADQDGVTDYCEQRLAEAFAPELAFDNNDDTRREPRWAARLINGQRIRIAYLFSYYKDLGSVHGSCGVPGPHYLCGPHNGDSELVAFEVAYNIDTERWVLHRAWFSAHGEYTSYTQGEGESYLGEVTGEIEYPGQRGGHARVWVARYKHANYPREYLCDIGGFLNADTCDNNDGRVRLEVPGNGNIGSRSHPFLDCVASGNAWYEYYGDGRQECYWSKATTTVFRGWVPNNIGGGDADHYADVIANVDF